MAFQLSPGVLVQEKDLTAVVPAVGTSIGGTAGEFSWGPCNQIVDVNSESDLVAKFGKPPATNYESWFAAASFLAYTGSLKVVRAIDTSAAKNAAVSGTGTLIENDDEYENNHASGNSDAQGMWAAKHPGTRGNGIVISLSDNSTHAGFSATGSWTSALDSTTINAPGADGAASTEAYVGAIVKDATGATIGTISAITDDDNIVLTANAAVAITTATITIAWPYADEFDYIPGTTQFASTNGSANDELHIIVVDKDGFITGTANTILEKFAGVSKASDAVNSFGESNYYRDVVNSQSDYIRWMDHPAGDATWGTLSTITGNYTDVLTGTEIYGKTSDGANGTYSAGNVVTAFNLFANDELVDVNLVFAGGLPVASAKSVIDNVADVRKDCLVFLSPDKASVVNNSGAEKTAILADISDAALTRSSYAVMDSGWKYMYDRWYDRYLWVPCNGDTAGICARTDEEADPWFSPAGYTRGRVKNAIKMAYSPAKSDRDALYKGGVNPIVGFPGSGIVLFGDKTLLEKPSAFDRINVRRLFITLEKAIATAAKFQLFEFNDIFTRSQFRNLVEPFLRDVQGRRGIYDFRVVCDETNNTQQVVDTNSFVADIFIQPARSINFITLTFVATRTGIQFDEIGG